MSWVVAARLAKLSVPLLRWPLLLNAEEAPGLVGLPLGHLHLPGLHLGECAAVAPATTLARRGAVVASSNLSGNNASTVTIGEAIRRRVCGLAMRSWWRTESAWATTA